MKHTYLDNGALFVEPHYRYRLWRRWKPSGNTVNFIMLNPSTADANVNDPTVERCEMRARTMGFNALTVTNLFAWRSTDPVVLGRVADPVGADNNEHIIDCARLADMVICAWGIHGSVHGRSAIVRSMLIGLGIQLHALKVTASGEPWHPLYLSYSRTPEPYPIDT